MKIFRLLLAFFALLASAPAFAGVQIRIDLAAQRLTVVRGGGETAVWKISSGRVGYETPVGHYSVMRMEADHHSDEYDQAPMPYAIFFSPRGLAIHGTFERGLGRPASHGCVRLSVANAQKLYEWVEQQGGASIEIVGETRSAMRRAPREERPRISRRPRVQDIDSTDFMLESVSRY